jgi:hypothetical protein
MGLNTLPSSDRTIDRRHFNRAALAGVTKFSALMSIALGGCNHKHKPHEEVSPEVRRRRLREAQSHPAIINPSQWLSKIDTEVFRRAMDLTEEQVKVLLGDCIEHRRRPRAAPGIRHHRTPAATAILRPENMAVSSIEKMVQIVGADPNEIDIVENPHMYCGAGAKFAQLHPDLQGDSDEIASREIFRRVQVLQQHGLRAGVGEMQPVEIIDGDPHYHPAILTWIDCTRGRLHDPHLFGEHSPHGYVVSSPDYDEVKESLNTTIDIARSRHGHGDLLEKYTAVALMDPKDRKYSDEIFRAVEEAARKRDDLTVRVVAHDVPRR